MFLKKTFNIAEMKLFPSMDYQELFVLLGIYNLTLTSN
jgi:hypothetical protein